VENFLASGKIEKSGRTTDKTWESWGFVKKHEKFLILKAFRSLGLSARRLFDIPKGKSGIFSQPYFCRYYSDCEESLKFWRFSALRDLELLLSLQKLSNLKEKELISSLEF